MIETNDELIDQIHEIKRKLNRVRWISDYRIFYHQNYILSLIKDKHEKLGSIANSNNGGIAIQIISSQNNYYEYNISLSSLTQLENIIKKTPYRKKSQPESASKFDSIQLPVFSSENIIETNIDEISLKEYLSTPLHDSMTEISFSQKIKYTTETIAITTKSSGIHTRMQSLGINRIHAYYYKSQHIDLARVFAATSLNLKIEDLQTILTQEIVFRRTVDMFDPRNQKLPILMHPEVGGLLWQIFFQNKHYLQFSDFSKYVPDNILIYDNPTQNGGLFSNSYTDEGHKSQQLDITYLLSNGSVDDLNEALGKYRYANHNTFYRSYQYPLQHYFTNINIKGGFGKGQSYTDRHEDFLFIRRGVVYLPGNPHDPQFLIHVQEADLWKRGMKYAPCKDFTVYGNFKEFLQYSSMSNDSELAFDSNIPGAVYLGYLWLDANYVNIR